MVDAPGMIDRGGNAHGETSGDALIRLGPLESYIGFHLRLAQEASFRAFAARVGDPTIKPSRFAMLTLIGQNPGLSQTALGRAIGRDKSTLTTALDDLAGRGLVHRERDPADRRSYRLTLTSQGTKILSSLDRHAAAHDRALDEIVGPDQKALLIAALKRIIAALG